MTRVGILGGSFNPVHRGHLALADFALSELNLEHVYFVPSFQTPLKSEKELLPAPARLKFLKKALKPYPNFSVSTCEMDRGGKSYTVDTLRHFHKTFQEKTVLYFLTGMDSLRNLAKWKSVDQIFKLCRFVVATRPGYRWEETEYPVIRMPFEALDISSSRVRRDFKSGKISENLVPDEISEDVKKYYRSPGKRVKKEV